VKGRDFSEHRIKKLNSAWDLTIMLANGQLRVHSPLPLTHNPNTPRENFAGL
jgi:hypothetical protein